MDITENWVSVAVCGAHMSGLPLNHQLVALGGQLVKPIKTAAQYRLYKLNGFEPPRPGLLCVPDHGGSIAVEIWRLPITQYGKFVASIPAPLGIGTLNLEDGTTVQGFLCESYATLNAVDCTSLGGWRNYLDAVTQHQA
jgi:allophanate hydrolase